MIVTIDPGASGGIVLGYPELVTIPMPKTDGDIEVTLRPGFDEPYIAYLEQLVKYTGRNMPSSSMAVYASNWGFLKGVLTAHKYRIILVPPKKWQSALGLGSATGLTKTEWKNKLKNMAQQLYPNLSVTLSTADAILIYEAAKRGALG